MPIPCVPDNAVAKQIIDSCAMNFAAHYGDCNEFLKAALGAFLAEGYLDGLNADAIVGKFQAPEQGWTRSRDIPTVIAMAKAGNLVVAGMTSGALSQSHGHVAVVVGCDGQPPGMTAVPVGYAGALNNPPARIEGDRLSKTFAASMVHGGQLDYYFKAPDRVPS